MSGLKGKKAAPPPAASTPLSAKRVVRKGTEAEAPKEATKKAAKRGNNENAKAEDEALMVGAPPPKAAKRHAVATPATAATAELTMSSKLPAREAELATMKAQLATMNFVANKFGSVPEGYQTFAENLRLRNPKRLEAEIPSITDDIRKKEDGVHRAPSAMSIIEAAKPKPSEDAAIDWLLSYPLMQEGKLPDPVNLSALQARFKKGEDAVQGTLTSARIEDGPVIVALQAGMGIGKSYAIDIADKLLFRESEPIVLKVAYNRQQDLSAEKESPKHAGIGFIARLMLFVLKVGVRKMPDVVEEVLKADPEGKELNPKEFVEWFLTQFPDSKSRPVIIAADELGMLCKGTSTNISDDPPLQGLLSTLANIIREFKTHPTRPRLAIGFVTALPHLNIKSLSSRTVFAFDAVAFTEEESVNFIRKNLIKAHSKKKPSGGFKSVVDEMLLYCGLHPRSLAVAATKYNSTRQVPTPADVARICSWKHAQGPYEGDIRDALVEAYGNPFSLGEKQQLLLRRAALMQASTGAWMIPPTFFWSDVDDSNLGNANLPLYHIREIFRFDSSNAPTKALGRINYYWNCFRSVNNLPLIPASITTEVEAEVTRLVFPRWFSVSEVDVLGKGRKCLIKEINMNTYYRPKAENHRAIESMCVARAFSPDSIDYLCLFQFTIDADLNGALDSLNVAAEDLKGVWGGKVLLIVFALGASRASSLPVRVGDHPTVVVDRDSIDKYFTPTIGATVRQQMARHGVLRAT